MIHGSPFQGPVPITQSQGKDQARWQMSNILAFLAGHLLPVQGVVSGAAVTVLGPPSKTHHFSKR